MTQTLHHIDATASIILLPLESIKPDTFCLGNVCKIRPFFHLSIWMPYRTRIFQVV